MAGNLNKNIWKVAQMSKRYKEMIQGWTIIRQAQDDKIVVLQNFEWDLGQVKNTVGFQHGFELAVKRRLGLLKTSI